MRIYSSHSGLEGQGLGCLARAGASASPACSPRGCWATWVAYPQKALSSSGTGLGTLYVLNKSQEVGTIISPILDEGTEAH